MGSPAPPRVPHTCAQRNTLCPGYPATPFR
jgi:hypothetical protein